MRRWARIGIVVVIVFLGGVGVWASRSWNDTQPLVTSTTDKPAFAAFTCGPIFGTASVEPSGTTVAATLLSRQPCRDRGQRRVLAGIDGVLGAAGLIGLLALSRRPGDEDEDPAPLARA